MAKGAAAVKAGGGFIKKMVGKLIRPASKKTGKVLDGMPAAASGAAKGAGKNADAAVKDALAKVNPKFGKVSLKKGAAQGDAAYKQNCCKVAQSYELRRRGMDVTAGPLEAGRKGYNTAAEVQNRWGRAMTSGSKDDIVKAFEQHGDGARGIVRISWNGGGGHAFNVENVGGTVRFIDGQPTPGVADAAHYFDKGTDAKYARLDDLPTPSQKDIDWMTE